MLNQTVQGQGLAAQPPARPLERMSIAADDVYRIAGNVQAFLDRFHGESPREDPAAAGTALQVSYRNEIDRLFAHLDTLSARVGALHDIG